ncbi:MAG: bifunctional glutamine synthetase adenylyltransferase/deadenyltransferase, partial [Gammaproteobacteria bacterium]|nr:bifunctional glutamine synthetase adenylyltransferase/deadenyltransferase [Gammaproteobacteria bacterium]
MNQASINYFNRRLLQLPDELQQEVATVFNEIVDQLPDSSTETHNWAGVLPDVLCSSHFIVSLIRRNPAYLNEIINNGVLFSPLNTEELSLTLKNSLTNTYNVSELMHQLRYIRNQSMLQIAFRDLAGWASLSETMTSLSGVADEILSATLTLTHELISQKSGHPVGKESASPQKMVILGMGKLGGGELNFSSDVDLIFCFAESGQTDSKRPISNSEFFIRQARLFIKLLTTQSADGFAYRVDTRLRPNGNSGPLCLSFSAMENYYQLHGRDWERYAYIKARVVAGSKVEGDQLLEILRPFVYRKYLDFSAVEAIRDMKEMIERELIRKKELQKNIKLGPGGIREVEFIAQAHQLIRGGRNKNLQQRNLLTALYQLYKSELISENNLNSLIQAYEFLRRCENRIQMYADQQTHNLPEESRLQI